MAAPDLGTSAMSMDTDPSSTTGAPSNFSEVKNALPAAPPPTTKKMSRRQQKKHGKKHGKNSSPSPAPKRQQKNGGRKVKKDGTAAKQAVATTNTKSKSTPTKTVELAKALQITPKELYDSALHHRTTTLADSATNQHHIESLRQNYETRDLLFAPDNRIDATHLLRKRIQVREFEARLDYQNNKIPFDDALKVLMNSWAVRRLVHQNNELVYRMRDLTEFADIERVVGAAAVKLLKGEDPLEGMPENIAAEREKGMEELVRGLGGFEEGMGGGV